MATSTSDGPPTREDGELLVQLYTLAQSERVARSFLWYYDFVGDVTDPDDLDFEAFHKRHPRGSEGYFKWTAIASFFETVGALVRNDVLSRALVFDRWPVDWYWRYLQPLVQADRDKGLLCDTAYYADNFECLAGEAATWRRRRQGKGKLGFQGEASRSRGQLTRRSQVPSASANVGRSDKGSTHLFSASRARHWSCRVPN